MKGRKGREYRVGINGKLHYFDSLQNAKKFIERDSLKKGIGARKNYWLFVAHDDPVFKYVPYLHFDGLVWRDVHEPEKYVKRRKRNPMKAAWYIGKTEKGYEIAKVARPVAEPWLSAIGPFTSKKIARDFFMKRMAAKSEFADPRLLSVRGEHTSHNPHRNPLEKSVPVTKPHPTSRAKDPAMTLRAGEEIRVKVFGRVYTIRAVGNEYIGGQLQIAGKSIAAKTRLFAGLRDYVVTGGNIVVGYLDDLKARSDLTIKEL